LIQANNELSKKITGFEDSVIDVFNYYSWPGNIRELRNVIRRAVLVEQGKTITTKSLPPEIISSKNHSPSNPHNTEKPENLRDLKEKTEQELILTTLEKVRYNKSKAAKILNIDRKTLYNKMRQYGLTF
jgi:two-component system response regulator HydG